MKVLIFIALLLSAKFQYLTGEDDHVLNSPDIWLTPNGIRWGRSLEGQLYLTEVELELYKLFKNYKANLEDKLRIVTEWLDDFEDSTLKGTQHLSSTPEIIDEVTSHPLMALRMIRRFVNLSPDILLKDEFEKKLEKALKAIEEKSDLPSTQDYEHSMGNIINIVYTNELSVKDVLNGKISDIQTNVGLTLEQAYEVALYAERMQAYTEAYFWLQAIRTLKDNGISSEEELQLVIGSIDEDILRVAEKHDILLDNLDDLNFWTMQHRFTTKMLPDNASSVSIQQLEQQTFKTFKDERKDQYDLFKYQKLCKGDSTLFEEVKSKQICFYESKIHPRWTINPLKIEVYSWDPYVVRYHDAVTDEFLEFLETESRPLMTDATVINNDFNESDSKSVADIFHNSRIATFCFLSEESEGKFNLEQRVSQMTGLHVHSHTYMGSPWSSEAVQIASYGTGGQYEYHMDALPDNFYDRIEGNRIATFMIYLSDVERGGDTVFPTLGISVKPIKKSAIFWYNLHKNGEDDDRTLHGGCPVLLGHKKIANFWIRGFASFLIRKCSLNPKE